MITGINVPIRIGEVTVLEMTAEFEAWAVERKKK
jgi:hypothetical protein